MKWAKRALEILPFYWNFRRYDYIASFFASFHLWSDNFDLSMFWEKCPICKTPCSSVSLALQFTKHSHNPDNDMIYFMFNLTIQKCYHNLRELKNTTLMVRIYLNYWIILRYFLINDRNLKIVSWYIEEYQKQLQLPFCSVLMRVLVLWYQNIKSDDTFVKCGQNIKVCCLDKIIDLIDLLPGRGLWKKEKKYNRVYFTGN